MSMKIKIDTLINRFKRVRLMTLSVWLCLSSVLITYHFSFGEEYSPSIEDKVIMEAGGKSVSYERSILDWHEELDISTLGHVDQDEIKKLEVILSERPDENHVYSDNTLTESPFVNVLVKMETEYNTLLRLLALFFLVYSVGITVINRSFVTTFMGIFASAIILYGPGVALAVVGVEKVKVQEENLVDVPTEQRDFVLTQVAQQLNLYEIAKHYAGRVEYHSLETSEAKTQILALKESVGVNFTEDEMASYTAIVNDARAKDERSINRFKGTMLALSVLLCLMTLWLHFLNTNYQIIWRYTHHKERAHFYRNKALHAKLELVQFLNK